MTHESLNRANVIEPKIKKLQQLLVDMNKVTGMKVDDAISFDSPKKYIHIQGYLCDFKVIHTLVKARIEEELKKLEDEFNSL